MDSKSRFDVLIVKAEIRRLVSTAAVLPEESPRVSVVTDQIMEVCRLGGQEAREAMIWND